MGSLQDPIVTNYHTKILYYILRSGSDISLISGLLILLSPLFPMTNYFPIA